MKLADENPSLDDDQIGTLSVQLSSPAPPVTIESLLTMVMVVGVVGFMMYEVLKD